ncbi:hypothetical protein D3C81_1375440 [compost metagenome]
MSSAASACGWVISSNFTAPLPTRSAWAAISACAACSEITEPMNGAGCWSKAPTVMLLHTSTSRAISVSPQAPCGTSRRRAQVQRWPAEMNAD